MLILAPKFPMRVLCQPISHSRAGKMLKHAETNPHASRKRPKSSENAQNPEKLPKILGVCRDSRFASVLKVMPACSAWPYMLTAVCANTALLAVNYHGDSAAWDAAQSVGDFVFVLLYLAEAAGKVSPYRLTL